MAGRILAGIVLVTGDKLLLVLSRKDEASGGRWSIPKGKFEPGTDDGLFAAAARELLEETGVDLARLS